MTQTALTFDVDWAPDHVIDAVAAALLKAKVKATWFITHPSPAIDRLRLHADLFELGIHPNFSPGSSHGNTDEEVLNYCMNMVPEARSMRTHGLYTSTGLLDKVAEQTPIKRDVSVLFHRAPEAPKSFHYWNGRRILRLAFTWEDDMEYRRNEPDWNSKGLFMEKGPCILNFHPIYLALSAQDTSVYEILKSKCPYLPDATSEMIDELRQNGKGPHEMFASFLKKLSGTDRSARISDIGNV